MKFKMLSMVMFISILSVSVFIINDNSVQGNLPHPSKEYLGEDTLQEKDEEEEMNEEKTAPWTEEVAANHQQMLQKYMHKPGFNKSASIDGISSYAAGKLRGKWSNRGAKNMPGAYKFSEMLDGTDTIYAVTLNHFSGEYNSKSYIMKGTVYNPTKGTGGDDFVRLTGHWPNMYNDLIALNYNNKTRLIAGILNGPVYYSDDEGKTWNLSAGLPNLLSSTVANRQTNMIYTTDGRSIYESNDGAESFTKIQDFGTSRSAALYSPRYSFQPNAKNVYLARDKQFYTLTQNASTFVKNGRFTNNYYTGSKFSIGGDSRKLYVTVDNKYWVSTNNGSSWTEKFPRNNYYGKRDGKMSAGRYIGVNPEDPNYVIGGYAQPVYSQDGLDTDPSDDSGWGRYQGGTSLPLDEYYDRIRFNYHPDFQGNQFFYNSSDELFSIRSSDGGLLVSYKDWLDLPIAGNLNNNGYDNAHFINITTLNSLNQLIYRNNLITGYKDETHIMYSTQDQGSQSVVKGTGGVLLDFYQSVGGDGPPFNSANGRYAWRYARTGKEVHIPTKVYDDSGEFKSARTLLADAKKNSKVEFTDSSAFNWLQTYVDHDEPDKQMWLLGKRLDRAHVNGNVITGTSISNGTGNQVTAIAQGHKNPNLIWYLQEAKVYKSYDRGNNFGSAVETPFKKTRDQQNYGGGWVLSTDDNFILFCGPSQDKITGSILSKDGGKTWYDVTGDFPAGKLMQTGGMMGTPDGKYIFAGTELGPWVFIVSEEKWYPIGEGGAYFNTTAIEYIPSTHSIRFATWGSGVWDFKIQDIEESAKLPFLPLLLLD